MRTSLPEILNAPELPEGMSENAKWLSGEGAGSWFVLTQSEVEKTWNIVRYAPKGSVECSGEFVSNLPFDVTAPFEVTYPSHCAKVTVVQKDQRVQLSLIDSV